MVKTGRFKTVRATSS